VQDRDGGRRLLSRLRHDLPTVRLVWADAGYAGKLVTWAAQVLTLAVQIVRKRLGPPGTIARPSPRPGHMNVIRRVLSLRFYPAGVPK
jgi:hypothetical protein